MDLCCRTHHGRQLPGTAYINCAISLVFKNCSTAAQFSPGSVWTYDSRRGNSGEIFCHEKHSIQCVQTLVHVCVLCLWVYVYISDCFLLSISCEYLYHPCMSDTLLPFQFGSSSTVFRWKADSINPLMWSHKLLWALWNQHPLPLFMNRCEPLATASLQVDMFGHLAECPDR